MGFFDFLKRKELTEIELLKKEIELAKEKEEKLSSEIDILQSRCSELSQYEKIADIEREKEKTLSFIQEQNIKNEIDKQQHINEINSLKTQIASLSEDVKQKEAKIVELDETILLQEFILQSMILQILKCIKTDLMLYVQNKRI